MHWRVALGRRKKKGKVAELRRNSGRNVPVRRPGSGGFQAEAGALGADCVCPRLEAEEPLPRQLVPAMACSSRVPDDKTNG